MSPSQRSSRIVPAAAVLAMTCAALAAAWLAPAQRDAIAAARPALDEAKPVMVKAPAMDDLKQAVACRDCAAPAAPTGRY